MFGSLTERLGAVFDRLRKKGALSESDVADALRDVRVALLEADVALPVVKDFIAAVGERARGQDVIRSVTPAQMVVKIVHDHLVETLGAEPSAVATKGTPPVTVLLLGLQGSGKTTTAAKLGRHLVRRERKKVLLASLDVNRPAAQQQLSVLGEQADVPVLEFVLGEQPGAIAVRAMEKGRREGYDVIVFDTAGRMNADEALMAEAAEIRDLVRPAESLLVADAMTGQDAVALARAFSERVGLSGIVLTRVDGDARGGAALSMRAVTGCPIKLLGVGENLDDLEPFQADRIAGRILGQGDVVGLVEKASEVIEGEEAEKLAEKMLRGRFTLEDMAAQLGQVRKMGELDGLLDMLPGVGKVKKQLAQARIDDKAIIRPEAIIRSMTVAERRNPKILNGSRRRRIAAGSGTSVQDVNRVLKQYQQMSTMMKKMGKLGKKGLSRGGGLSGAVMPSLPPGPIKL